MDADGLSPAMQKLASQLRLAAATDASVFIVGESGTGKEIVARAIHETSDRRDQPFVAVNCGAISGTLAHAELFGHEKGSFTGAVAQNAGYFEYASGGTLFLDEVTEMPPDMQVHFLRVLESGTYQRVGGADLLRANVRVICASNRDPQAAVAEGRLRQDFLHRLLVVPLRVPPLRERGDDARILAQRFLDALNREHGTQKAFSRAMQEAIAQHDWPGNVRELRNTVQRAYILADAELDASALARARDVPRGELRDGTLCLPVGMPLERAQREYILATLAHHEGDKRLAAQTLGISLKTLYNRLDAYGLDVGES
ncbi:sigma-54 interaction domain-containing protein [Achromobacter pulmonis]|nr:sigma-54 dependent transcriptional regulator [Achromobacter pulmonis]